MLEEGTPMGGHVQLGRLALLTLAYITKTATHFVMLFAVSGEEILICPCAVRLYYIYIR